MAGNSFGQLFRITTFGESHGGAVGVVLDGCPPGIEITEGEIQKELDRRKPGQSKITTSRKEADKIKILSGYFEGKTTGTPMLLVAYNEEFESDDYLELKEAYRPSHADFTYEAKYGFRDWRGSGRASARETLARVAAAAVARKYLKEKLRVEFISYVDQVGAIQADVDYDAVTAADVESNIIRCPDQKAAKKMIELIEKAKAEGDSVGGVIQGVIRNVPAGLGEPVFDKIPADLAKAMLSINAVKGFEIGSGFRGVALRGSEHNDPFYVKGGRIRTKTNNAGGTYGGITSGETIHFRVAFKPVSTIKKEQDTVNRDKKSVKLSAAGRHDPCVLPRAVPIVEAMAALVLMDHYLRNKAQNG
ncbi:chorismate synthase [Candidatus Kaiserbacteria bacterium RIFCSPHIGHO2_02_FULL_59_21]|uniref:Chorismate synthase n=1 Tax=Candidatus Kaiserbacteria bacterium RIFCSPHIGHO2_02_FULL_59_21 TaxID=1798500 RepID=A0A1F6DZL2_9BACT|nr:MAG: chorismate synthase [Candidatus Kaiserbacteria bacterium RIFCSPHIGHO2_01_FULL_58_22]OGG66853.1 MAG: chorismate synthase [Candidatus Kaiserbacteria bacterium RIFCSPHIGHO2_02_FULL_59_21]OGG80739.1 MAG: chorismate synthase [Candidatus Kaiserbacteria bacterium RIFCSPLOWO2_01_FULL_59_34]